MIYTFLLDAAAGAAKADSAANGAGGILGSGGGMWIMLILIFVVMWLFMIRPQRKQEKAIREMRNSLQKGDKVVSAGGIYGTIVEVQETSVLIKVDGDTKLRIDKNCINKDTTAEAPKADAKSKEKE